MGSSALKERKIYSILGGILFSLINTGAAEDISLKEARSILVKNSQDSNQQRISQLLQFYVRFEFKIIHENLIEKRCIVILS